MTIGHEDQQVTRLPWVTILVLANVVVFLLTNQLVQQQSVETREGSRESPHAAEHSYPRPAGNPTPSRPPLPE
jgi:hypothetical protein